MLHAAHLGAASLALFLVSATVVGELASPLLTGPQPVEPLSAGEDAPPLSGFLQAVLVTIELAPFHDANRTDLCSYMRIVETSYRPVLITGRNHTGCQQAERIDLQFSLAGTPRPVVLGGRMAICHASSYTITTIRGADRISGVDVTGCLPVTVTTRLQTVAGAAPYPFLEGRTLKHPPTEPGLYVACAAVLVAAPDGTEVVVQDLTWFEVRKAGAVPPRVEGPRQSTAWNTPCADVGVPFEDDVGAWGLPRIRERGDEPGH